MDKAVEDILNKATQGNISKEEAIILSEATRRALKHMIALEIPLIPSNFELWFLVFLHLMLKGITAPQEKEILEVYNQIVSERKKEREPQEMIYELQEETRRVLKYSGESILRSVELLEGHDKFLEEKEKAIGSAKEIKELTTLMEVLIKEIRNLRLENRNLRDELQKSARRINTLRDQLKKVIEKTSFDPLTSTANRSKFERELRRLLIKYDKTKEKFSLIMCDLDDFKRVNDLYGHRAGDEVLREFAYILQKDLRMTDIVSRYGGEEFAILLPGLVLKEAVAVAERLRRRVEELVIRWGDDIIKVTASFGVAEVRDGDRPETIIQRADEALYLAKLDGKNCVRSEIDVAVRRGSKPNNRNANNRNNRNNNSNG